MTPITKNFDFGNLYLHENYVIAVMHQGITVLPEYNKYLVEIADTYYKDTPFVYITHRKHSYAVDPSVYFETSKIENLRAFAVVSQKEIDARTVPVEKIFFKKPFQLFDDLEEAIAWALEKVKE